mmetsp:Transcript_16537/g.46168  ORF Transcript_16537/g.46168 Transcript_16537/m.46168 type:complete len:214 (+) Transcript_16537:64-705(+)|eukprot:CAMPEP_0117660488 /NCGR_PEP_ID=MMETSP0804-20121206/6995_1 /TAXON_ID=1074897 /ORGANISM="Tetraselmis astigmatica, Strain CCMP880" /LENGTH=213 /DNA_ID=CAMNT_0005467221 /DNA_START=57 /DNA_END=698 /DNA_ORIENTATION=-
MNYFVVVLVHFSLLLGRLAANPGEYGPSEDGALQVVSKEAFCNAVGFQSGSPWSDCREASGCVWMRGLNKCISSEKYSTHPLVVSGVLLLAIMGLVTGFYLLCCFGRAKDVRDMGLLDIDHPQEIPAIEVAEIEVINVWAAEAASVEEQQEEEEQQQEEEEVEEVEAEQEEEEEETRRGAEEIGAAMDPGMISNTAQIAHANMDFNHHPIVLL